MGFRIRQLGLILIVLGMAVMTLRAMELDTPGLSAFHPWEEEAPLWFMAMGAILWLTSLLSGFRASPSPASTGHSPVPPPPHSIPPSATPGLCRQCGQPVLPGDRFCGHCGAPQS